MTLDEWTDIVARMSPDQRAAMALYGLALSQRVYKVVNGELVDRDAEFEFAMRNSGTALANFSAFYPGEATAAGEG